MGEDSVSHKTDGFPTVKAFEQQKAQLLVILNDLILAVEKFSEMTERAAEIAEQELLAAHLEREKSAFENKAVQLLNPCRR